MNIWFAFREGLKGFRRARLATIISITSVAVALVMVGMFILFSLNMDRWIGHVRSKVELEIFLEPVIKTEEGQQIAERIRKMEGVAAVRYVDKDMAARRFEEQFGRNIYEVLDTNPLPPSVTVRFAEGSQNSKVVERIAARIRGLEGVDEVIYQKELLALVDRYVHLIYLIAAAIGGGLFVIAFVLLHNTIRLTIHARSDIIEIMKLVGATSRFIRRPFIVEGFFQGLLGGLFSSVLVFLLIKMIQKFIYPYLVYNAQIFLTLIIAGAVIGIISSKVSVSKYLKSY